MAEEELTAEFPVVLFNGERRINVGNIEIHPMLDYKQFRMVLNQMIGISYNNLTTYLVVGSQKILITGKVDLSGLVREKTCYFLVVLKRSRRDRRKKPNKGIKAECRTADSIWFHELQIQRRSYINSTIINYGFDRPMNTNFPQMIESSCPRVQSCRNRELCADCTNADKVGEEPPFHFCVYDEVVEGFFRSPAGPICRPR